MKNKRRKFCWPTIPSLMNDKVCEATMIYRKVGLRSQMLCTIVWVIKNFETIIICYKIKIKNWDERYTYRLFSWKCWWPNEEQEERFHQDIGTKWQDLWNVTVMANYCLSIKRYISETIHKKITFRSDFTENSWNYLSK